MNRSFVGLFGALLATGSLCAQSTNAPTTESKDAAYTRTLNERAMKIVASLGITADAKSNQVHSILVQQYRALNEIHSKRDGEIAEAKAKHSADKTSANMAIETVRTNTKPKLDKLHGEFLARLSAEISPENVVKVKDEMTYRVLPLTYGVYLKMYPDLTDEQKAQIKTWLTEARELAMDGSTSDEKHAVFGKYKGKINNYLSKAGYDAKKAEQNLKKSTTPPSETKPQKP